MFQELNALQVWQKCFKKIHVGEAQEPKTAVFWGLASLLMWCIQMWSLQKIY